MWLTPCCATGDCPWVAWLSATSKPEEWFVLRRAAYAFGNKLHTATCCSITMGNTTFAASRRPGLAWHTRLVPQATDPKPTPPPPIGKRCPTFEERPLTKHSLCTAALHCSRSLILRPCDPHPSNCHESWPHRNKSTHHITSVAVGVQRTPTGDNRSKSGGGVSHSSSSRWSDTTRTHCRSNSGAKGSSTFCQAPGRW